MRSAIVLVMFLTFGCASMRAPTRTEMVEVTPDPSIVVAPPPPPSHSAAAAPGPKSSHWQGFVIGGAIASLVGMAFIIGGGVGWQQQQAANARANNDCMVQGGVFCGAFDDFTYLPMQVLIGIGVPMTAAGITLLAIGFHRERTQQ
jgi:hypothetical protein